MAEQSLFPTFSVPVIETPTAAQERKYRRSLYFDYDTGDFRQDGAGKIVEADGREAYKQWCMKVAMTERFTRLAYTTDIGTEMIDALNQEDREAVQSAVERTITEAFMVNPKTEYVRGFSFTWEGDSLFCTCIVKGHDWEEFSVGIPASKWGGVRRNVNRICGSELAERPRCRNHPQADDGGPAAGH